MGRLRFPLFFLSLVSLPKFNLLILNLFSFYTVFFFVIYCLFQIDNGSMYVLYCIF